MPAVANPDIQIRAGGQSPKVFFRPFGPQFGLKIREVGGGGVPGPALDPPGGGGWGAWPSPGPATILEDFETEAVTLSLIPK